MKAIQPYFLTLNRDEQLATIEALIFSASEPLTPEMLFSILFNKDEYDSINQSDSKSISFKEFESIVFEHFHYSTGLIDDLIKEVNNELISTRRPYKIIKVAGGYQFATENTYGEIVTKFYNYKSKKKLTQAAIETLAIIAYKQPISKSSVEEIRGVNSNEVVNSLLDRGLIKITGRSENLGKALLYGTTEEFLKLFGLYDLKDLPKLRELDEIANYITDSENTQESIINN